MIADDLPKEEADGWAFIGIGPDDRLYVTIGGCPATTASPRRGATARIRRINLDGSGPEVLAQGVRNSLGFDWSPVNRDLYFTDNGRDWLSGSCPRTSSTG